MNWKTRLFASALRFSTAIALVSCICAQSFGAIIVTPVLRSQTFTTVSGAAAANVVVDIYGSANAGTQAVGAFGVTVSLTGPGARTAFVVTVPGAIDATVAANEFRQLQNPTNVSTNTGAPLATQTFTFTRSRMAGFFTPAPENVNISSAALPTTGQPVETARLIGTIAFTVADNGVYAFTTAAATVTPPNSGALSGFLTHQGTSANPEFAPVAGGTTFNPGNFNITAVPEPSSMALLAVVGLAGFGWIRRKSKHTVS
ncbi:MAG: PEP-CTERM sorting domain-containing protein [Pirellula sp.]